MASLVAELLLPLLYSFKTESYRGLWGAKQIIKLFAMLSFLFM